jgi:hypothetical protein
MSHEIFNDAGSEAAAASQAEVRHRLTPPSLAAGQVSRRRPHSLRPLRHAMFGTTDKKPYYRCTTTCTSRVVASDVDHLSEFQDAPIRMPVPCAMFDRCHGFGKRGDPSQFRLAPRHRALMRAGSAYSHSHKRHLSWAVPGVQSVYGDCPRAGDRGGRRSREAAMSAVAPLESCCQPAVRVYFGAEVDAHLGTGSIDITAAMQVV